MIRNIIWAVVIVVLVVSGVVLYRQWKGNNTFGSGDVFTRNGNRDARDKTDGAYTDLDGNSRRSDSNPAQDTAANSPDRDPSASPNGSANSTSPNRRSGTSGNYGAVSTAPPQTPYGSNYRTASDTTTTTVNGLPATDSLSPNVPDNLRFGGNGRFQWYRQGDLTYRVDTQTGVTCVDYATMEEWRKPIVYRNACPRH